MMFFDRDFVVSLTRTCDESRMKDSLTMYKKKLFSESLFHQEIVLIEMHLHSDTKSNVISILTKVLRISVPFVDLRQEISICCTI
jgi:hypothetical protein